MSLDFLKTRTAKALLGVAIVVVVSLLCFSLLKKKSALGATASSGGFPGIYNATTTDLVLRDGFGSALAVDRSGRVILSPSSTAAFASVSSSQFIAGAGSITDPSFTFSGDRNSGMYDLADGILGFVSDGSLIMAVASSAGFVANGTFGSGSNNAYDIGSATKSWKDAYVSSTLYASSTKVGLGTVGAPTITFNSDPDTGVYSGGANTLNLAAGGAVAASMTASTFAIFPSSAFLVGTPAYMAPGTNNTTDIGRASASFKDVYASGTANLGEIRALDATITTSTIFVGTLSGKRGRVCVGDMDGTGFTCMTGNNGVLSAYSTSTY